MDDVLEGSPNWQLIKEYIEKGQGAGHDTPVELLGIMKVTRPDEMLSDIQPKYFLWHGTQLQNVLCILLSGLRIHNNAEKSGSMFGNGHYFADVFTKSLIYCYIEDPEEACMLLFEVDTGREWPELFGTKMTRETLADYGYNCLKGVGRDEPLARTAVRHPKDNYIVPIGPIKTQLSTLAREKVDFANFYNEFVVYNDIQERLKFIVRIKRLPKKGME